VRRLLNNVQSRRLGKIRSGNSTVMNHKWFDGFDWVALKAGHISPPIVPITLDLKDTSNFDKFGDEEVPVRFNL